jgi:GNAT superfamily N-acetyltransferase
MLWGFLSSMDIASRVRALSCASQEVRDALGGPLYSAEVGRSFANMRAYESGNLPARNRVLLGWCASRDDAVVGYAATTLLRDAAPTAYERTNIGLVGPLSYVHAKILVVDPDWWGCGVGHELLTRSIDLARANGLPVIGDIRKENGLVHGFALESSWCTPGGAPMLRLRLDA